MAERYVPCTCPACKGSLVTRYTRRKHSKLYADIEVPKDESEEVNVIESRCLSTPAQLTTFEEDNTGGGVDDNGGNEIQISPKSAGSSPDRSSADEDGKMVKIMCAYYLMR